MKMKSKHLSLWSEFHQPEGLAAELQSDQSDDTQEADARNQTEYKTRLALKYYPKLYNHIPCINFTVDLVGGILAVNQFVSARLGYTVDELSERSIFSCFHGEDQQRLQTELTSILQHSLEPECSLGTALPGEYRLVCQDNRLICVKITVCTKQISAQKPIMLLVCEDISDYQAVKKALQKANDDVEKGRVALEESTQQWQQMQAELQAAKEELRQKNEELIATRSSLEAETQRYRELFEFAPDSYLVTDIDGTIREANCTAAKLLNASQKLLVGKPLLNFIPPKERRAFRAELLHVCQQERVQEWECVLHPRKASPICTALTVTTVRNQKNEAIALRWLIHDITKRKQVEAALQESEQRYRCIIETSLEGLWILDAENKTSFVNNRMATMLGYTPEEMLGLSLFDFMHEEDIAIAKGSIERRRQGIEENHDFKYRRKDGSELWTIVSASPIFDAAGNYAGALGMITDITKRKQAEVALQQQNERSQLMGAIAQRIRQSLNLEEILNTTVAEVQQFLQTERVIIYRFEPDWSAVVAVESVAPGCLSILGRTLPEVCFQSKYIELYKNGRIGAIEDIYTADLTPCHLEFLQQLQVRANLVLPILQGENLWGLLIAHHCSAPRQWQPFEIDCLKQLTTQVAIAIQQSSLFEQVQQLNTNLEQQVQERTVQFQQALGLETVLKRITDKVRDSLDESQILQTAVRELALVLNLVNCNSSLYNLEQKTATIFYEYKTSLPAYRGRVLQMANHPEIYNPLLEGQCFQFCSLLTNPIRGQVAMLACPIFDDRGVLGDLWLVHRKDYVFNYLEIRLVQQVANQCAIAIRQARLYQKAQTQVEELEKVNRLKDDFLSTVSHELRTPVSNMKMAIHMLAISLKQEREKFIEVFNSEAQKSKTSRYFQILHDECEREITLINDLLDLQRLDAGSHSLVLTAIYIETWLPQIIEPFTERIHNRQQKLRTEIAPNLPVLISDPSSLERILAELLNNACKYTPAEEQITVTASVQSDILQISVINSGIEIATSELNRIFEKFYRIPSADPWKQGGTGLGLALVKKLTEYLGGKIRVESACHQTRFTIELPLNMTALKIEEQKNSKK